MKIYGLTGNIGSGKSTVALMLRELGAFTVDADEVSREIVRPGEPALAAIAARFGRGILRPDGSLDREKLAGIAFSDDRARKDLNAITHPRILERIREKISALGEDVTAFVEAALIVENDGALGELLDGVVVVTCPPEIRKLRTAERGDVTSEQFRMRSDAQMSEEEKSSRADFLVKNDSDIESLRTRVSALWVELGTVKP